MAPSRRIKNVRCGDSFVEAARTILAARIEEVEQRRAAVRGPEDSEPLHDLRIASKRLRYSLETFAVCFPENGAQALADRVRDLQDILGRIHDLDVLADLLAGRIALMDDEARRRGLEIARDGSRERHRGDELQKLVWGDRRHARLGLYSTIAAKADQRREQYARFEALWSEWEETGLLRSIREMISGVTDATAAPPSGSSLC